MIRIFLWILSITLSLSAENVTLCYHEFGYSLTRPYSILPEVFEWQLSFIQEKKVSFLSLKDMIAIYSKKKGRIGNNVLVTMDDGWKSEMSVLPLIEQKKVPVTMFLFPQVLNKGKTYFSFKDLEKLKKSKYIDFGCHSFSHKMLLHCSTNLLDREIVESRVRLEKILRRNIEVFAYPYGSFDVASKEMAAENYALCFGVEDGPNTIAQDVSDIRREVISKDTSFGEFMEIIGQVESRKQSRDHRIKTLKFKDHYLKNSRSITLKLFQFPARERDRVVLIVPNSSIGPGWIYKLIDQVTRAGVQATVLIPRNSNVPFYRPDKEMRLIADWGLNVYMDDIQRALDDLSKKKRIVVVTWADGFDMVTALLSRQDNKKKIKGMVCINPSIRTSKNDKSTFYSNILFYSRRARQGQYVAETLDFFKKVKTLSDLMVLRPDELSPFAKELGYHKMSNFDALIKLINDEKDPDLALHNFVEHYTMDDFKNAFMRPLPVFSMVVPAVLLKDINRLWYQDFSHKQYRIINKDKLDLNMVYLYSSGHKACVDRILRTFPGLKNKDFHYFQGMSTIEMMLSDKANEIMKQEILELLP